MKIIHILLLGMACLSCSSVNPYTLNGILPEDCNVTEIYLVSQEGKGADTLARCPVGSDKSFKLKGKSENRLLYLNVGSRGGRIYFYPESGAYRLKKMEEGYQVVAEEQQNIQSRLNSHLNAIEKNAAAMRDLQQQEARSTGENGEKWRLENERLWLKGNDLLLDMIADFKDTDVAVTLVRDNMWIIIYDFKFFTQVIEAMGKGPESEVRSEVMQKYEAEKAKQLTGKVPDFKLPDMKGNIVKLSDYKGKYLLVDFWASWCKPCRVKAKELKKHYPRLNELGVEVVGISCDENKNQWLKAIEEDQPMWIQLLIDKKINGSDTADDYKVEFIPTLYLISPEGEVLEKNPNVEEIETFVKKG